MFELNKFECLLLPVLITVASLAKNNLACAAHFFVHFFAIVLHDQRVKLSSYMFYEGKYCRFFFSLLLIFTLEATGISIFSLLLQKLSRFSCNPQRCRH